MISQLQRQCARFRTGPSSVESYAGSHRVTWAGTVGLALLGFWLLSAPAAAQELLIRPAGASAAQTVTPDRVHHDLMVRGRRAVLTTEAVFNVSAERAHEIAWRFTPRDGADVIGLTAWLGDRSDAQVRIAQPVLRSDAAILPQNGFGHALAGSVAQAEQASWVGALGVVDPKMGATVEVGLRTTQSFAVSLDMTTRRDEHGDEAVTGVIVVATDEGVPVGVSVRVETGVAAEERSVLTVHHGDGAFGRRALVQAHGADAHDGVLRTVLSEPGGEPLIVSWRVPLAASPQMAAFPTLDGLADVLVYPGTQRDQSVRDADLTGDARVHAMLGTTAVVLGRSALDAVGTLGADAQRSFISTIRQVQSNLGRDRDTRPLAQMAQASVQVHWPNGAQGRTMAQRLDTLLTTATDPDADAPQDVVVLVLSGASARDTTAVSTVAARSEGQRVHVLDVMPGPWSAELKRMAEIGRGHYRSLAQTAHPNDRRRSGPTLGGDDPLSVALSDLMRTAHDVRVRSVTAAVGKGQRIETAPAQLPDVPHAGVFGFLASVGSHAGQLTLSGSEVRLDPTDGQTAWQTSAALPLLVKADAAKRAFNISSRGAPLVVPMASRSQGIPSASPQMSPEVGFQRAIAAAWMNHRRDRVVARAAMGVAWDDVLDAVSSLEAEPAVSSDNVESVGDEKGGATQTFGATGVSVGLEMLDPANGDRYAIYDVAPLSSPARRVSQSDLTRGGSWWIGDAAASTGPVISGGVTDGSVGEHASSGVALFAITAMFSIMCALTLGFWRSVNAGSVRRSRSRDGSAFRLNG